MYTYINICTYIHKYIYLHTHTYIHTRTQPIVATLHHMLVVVHVAIIFTYIYMCVCVCVCVCVKPIVATLHHVLLIIAVAVAALAANDHKKPTCIYTWVGIQTHTMQGGDIDNICYMYVLYTR